MKVKYTMKVSYHCLRGMLPGSNPKFLTIVIRVNIINFFKFSNTLKSFVFVISSKKSYRNGTGFVLGSIIFHFSKNKPLGIPKTRISVSNTFFPFLLVLIYLYTLPNCYQFDKTIKLLNDLDF